MRRCITTRQQELIARYGNLDTLGGSSGSGVLDSSGRIVGVHTNGGCTSGGGTNSGVRIARIRAVSGVL